MLRGHRWCRFEVPRLADGTYAAISGCARRLANRRSGSIRTWIQAFRAAGTAFTQHGLPCVLLLACSGGTLTEPAPAEGISLEPSAWVIDWSPGMPAAPDPSPGGGWRIDFPITGHGSLHYVTTAYHGPAGGMVTATLRVDRDPGVTFVADDGGRPAITLYLQRRGDDWHSAGFRWWCPAGRYQLDQAGERTISCPLDPAAWTGIDGKANPAAFTAALGDLENVGLTFGGTFFGHGVSSSGRARVSLFDYTLADGGC
jgi:hypothetical protein